MTEGTRVHRQQARDCRYAFIAHTFIQINFNRSLAPSLIHSFIYSFVHSFIHSFIHLFILSLISSFIHSFFPSYTFQLHPPTRPQPPICWPVEASSLVEKSQQLRAASQSLIDLCGQLTESQLQAFMRQWEGTNEKLGLRLEDYRRALEGVQGRLARVGIF